MKGSTSLYCNLLKVNVRLTKMMKRSRQCGDTCWCAFVASLILWMCLFAPVVFAKQENMLVSVVYLSRVEDPLVPLSLLDLPIEDNGRQGARLGIRDNQTTGEFLGHAYTLDEVLVEPGSDIATAAQGLADDGHSIIIADLIGEDLLAIADAVPDVLILNVRAKHNGLRSAECRANVMHLLPSRAMISDGLAQYLAWKRWTKMVLVTGRHDVDIAYANSFLRAAKRFGLEVVERKSWTSIPGARRTDSGHHTSQREVPVFTRFKKHDVLVVADEMDEFGEYLLFNTSEPRLVAGTQGLIATQWHRSQEQWGATQIQRRFQKLASRPMSERDYSAWAAVRALGEAVSQSNSNNPEVLQAFMFSDDFKLAGFKGVPLTFRRWNGQLRQPILIVGPRMLISVSPQKGFLHERSELDTLGFDEPDSDCRQF